MARPAAGALEERDPHLGLILSQWPRFRSECDFWRFANAYLRHYFPNLLSQSQLNHRIRALEPELRSLQRDLAATLVEPSAAYHVLDTTLIPAMFRVRACRNGLGGGEEADAPIA